ncbi:probable RNA-directed DNA polymerase from transposon BS [Trichonephila clavipes]|nr:probable RNA-directed DNA polymerase from transposon BS [Trichonephila clavipes]
MTECIDQVKNSVDGNSSNSNSKRKNSEGSPNSFKKRLKLEENEKDFKADSSSCDVLKEGKETTDKCATQTRCRRKLTAENVKTILRYVLANEPILAMVQKQMQLQKKRQKVMENEGRLTRSKTKALNKPQLPVTPAKNNDEETIQLLEEEYSEESASDEDYKPNYDELSDDDVASSVKVDDLNTSIIDEPIPPNPKIIDSVSDDEGALIIALPENKDVPKEKELFNTFGIRDRALSWIFDFLKDREIRVRFRDSLSKTFRLSQGVPQGSVLSPLLFSLYIAGIEKIISRRCEVGLFADDIVLWNSNSDVVHIETAINTTLSDIQIFAQQHKLIFNVSKSTSSFFTTNRRLYNYQPQIFMESKSLPYEKHPKYLGYILDPEILSNKHIDYVINKGRKRLDLLKYIAGRDWGADAGTLRLTYTFLIRPVLEYGSQIYFSASRTNLAKLDQVQSSAARIITGMRHSCPTDLVLFEADIMPLDLRRKLLLSKYFCKLYSYGDYNRTSAYLITWTNRLRLKRDSPFSRMQAMDLLDQDIEEHF